MTTRSPTVIHRSEVRSWTHRFTYGLAAVPIATAMLGSMPAQAENDKFELVSTIAVVNALTNRPPNTPEQVFNSAEIYLIDPDGGNPRRLTHNNVFDAGGPLSPDGKKLVFNSNRNRAPGEPTNDSDLFVMKNDGRDQRFLVRGSAPSWSPKGNNIVYHASVSGTGTPIVPDGGAPTSDSDIFVANVDDLLAGADTPRNITNTPDHVDDDPDWSPDGARIVYTRYDIIPGDPVGFSTSDVFVLNADGSGEPTRLTDTARSERAPEWSPDGNRIVYQCPSDVPTITTFEICVMNADGEERVQLTNNTVGDLGPHWSPDGQHIVFQRAVGGGRNQVFVINPDDIDPNDPGDPDRIGTQITGVRPGDLSQGWNGVGGWDLLRVKVDS